MRVLLTGASGFLGRVIYAKLQEKHKVISIGRTDFDNIRIKDLVDISGLPALEEKVKFVFHVAGLAHISPKNEVGKKAFNHINYEGTKNLCSWIDNWLEKPESFVFISSVSVYGVDYGKEINETNQLNGNTPYAKSKIKAEQFLIEWGKKNGIKVLILRLPLLIGANPPGNLGKMISAIKRGMYFSIGGGKARKSMVLADDVADLVNNCPKVDGAFNLTDGYHPTFTEVESVISSQLNRSKPFKLPIAFANILGKIGDLLPFFPINTNTVNKMVNDLTFSDLKARQQLAWKPSSVIENWKI
jgi:nucleoside-diphosphate-sugar epimerase